jgi:hypothetical protein
MTRVAWIDRAPVRRRAALFRSLICVCRRQEILAKAIPRSGSDRSRGRHGKNGGAGGIRTLDRALQPYNGLANRRLQPLGHSSLTADMPDAAPCRKRQICGCGLPGQFKEPRTGSGRAARTNLTRQLSIQFWMINRSKPASRAPASYPARIQVVDVPNSPIRAPSHVVVLSLTRNQAFEAVDRTSLREQHDTIWCAWCLRLLAARLRARA